MTRQLVMVGLLAVMISAAAMADTAPAATKPAAQPTTDSIFKTDLDKASYAIGIQIGKNFKQQGADINIELLAKGLADAMADTSLMTDEQGQQVLMAFTAAMRKQAAERHSAEAAENKKKGDAFLAENKVREGVVTTTSGLQYKVLTPGTGAIPGPDDTVTVHYKGTLIDGTEFDSSYSRGAPAPLKVNGVVAGWSEALQLMQVGAKWQLVIPSELAYGVQGRRGKIGPNAVLVFEIELLDTQPSGLRTQPAK